MNIKLRIGTLCIIATLLLPSSRLYASDPIVTATFVLASYAISFLDGNPEAALLQGNRELLISLDDHLALMEERQEWTQQYLLGLPKILEQVFSDELDEEEVHRFVADYASLEEAIWRFSENVSNSNVNSWRIYFNELERLYDNILRLSASVKSRQNLALAPLLSATYSARLHILNEQINVSRFISGFDQESLNNMGFDAINAEKTKNVLITRRYDLALEARMQLLSLLHDDYQYILENETHVTTKDRTNITDVLVTHLENYARWLASDGYWHDWFPATSLDWAAPTVGPIHVPWDTRSWGVRCWRANRGVIKYILNGFSSGEWTTLPTPKWECPAKIDYYQGFALPDNEEIIQKLVTSISEVWDYSCPTAYDKHGLSASVIAAWIYTTEHDENEARRMRNNEMNEFMLTCRDEVGAQDTQSHTQSRTYAPTPFDFEVLRRLPFGSLEAATKLVSERNSGHASWRSLLYGEYKGLPREGDYVRSGLLPPSVTRTATQHEIRLLARSIEVPEFSVTYNGGRIELPGQRPYTISLYPGAFRNDPPRDRKQLFSYVMVKEKSYTDTFIIAGPKWVPKGSYRYEDVLQELQGSHFCATATTLFDALLGGLEPISRTSPWHHVSREIVSSAIADAGAYILTNWAEVLTDVPCMEYHYELPVPHPCNVREERKEECAGGRLAESTTLDLSKSTMSEFAKSTTPDFSKWATEHNKLMERIEAYYRLHAFVSQQYFAFSKFHLALKLGKEKDFSFTFSPNNTILFLADLVQSVSEQSVAVDDLSTIAAEQTSKMKRYQKQFKELVRGTSAAIEQEYDKAALAGNFRHILFWMKLASDLAPTVDEWLSQVEMPSGLDDDAMIVEVDIGFLEEALVELGETSDIPNSRSDQKKYDVSTIEGSADDADRLDFGVELLSRDLDPGEAIPVSPEDVIALAKVGGKAIFNRARVVFTRGGKVVGGLTRREAVESLFKTLSKGAKQGVLPGIGMLVKSGVKLTPKQKKIAATIEDMVLNGKRFVQTSGSKVRFFDVSSKGLRAGDFNAVGQAFVCGGRPGCYFRMARLTDGKGVAFVTANRRFRLTVVKDGAVEKLKVNAEIFNSIGLPIERAVRGGTSLFKNLHIVQ